jgi:predicted PurR-regulated permease PerM
MDSAEASRGRITPAEGPSAKQLLNVVLSAVIVCALYLGRDFLIPLALAVLLAFILAPLVHLLRRGGLPRVAAVLIAVSVSLGALSAAGLMIASQVGGLLDDLPKYQGTIQAKIGDVGALTTSKLTEITRRLGLKAVQARHPAAKAAGLSKGLSATAAPVATPVEIYQPPPTPLEIARQILHAVSTPLAVAGLVFVVAVFILLQQADLRDRLIRLFGSGDLHRTTVAMNDAAGRLSRYFLSQLGVNVAFGTVLGFGLHVIGVPHALLWGAVAALLRFIPFIGSLVTVGLAASMAAAAGHGWSMVAWTLILFMGIEGVTSQIVEPFLYGCNTGLSPVSVVVAAIFWTWLWGPVGLFLSTPISLCLLVLGRHVPRLEFIEVLLGDRPPLTPAQSFYQRVLAGDSDEALEQAALILKDGPLSAYYDQVAIRGLLLAADDAHRGILKRDRLLIVKSAVESVIGELADHPDVDESGPSEAGVGPSTSAPMLERKPTPRSLGATDAYDRKYPVLCVGGPGLLDDVASMMLAQILEKHGLAAQVAPYRGTTRDRIGELDLPAFQAVCIFHLGVGRNPTRLQHLLARIAERCPSTPLILVIAALGGPASDEPILVDKRFVKVATLRDAVDACVASTDG